MLAGALLDAEAKIGEILKNTPKEGKTKEYGNSGGTIPTLPKGITKNQSSQFQTLAENPEIIEQVKAEAIENDDLPTRTEVLRKIKEIPKATTNPKTLEKSKSDAHQISKQEQVKKLGFTQKQSEQFQMLAENLDIIVS